MKKVSLLVISIAVILASCGKNTKEMPIRVGINPEYKPYEYFENGEIIGINADVTRKVFEKAGIGFEFIDMTFDGLIPALQLDKIDMIVGVSPTDERRKNIDFSISYDGDKEHILTLKNNDTIHSAPDLEGKKIGVQLGTLQELVAQEIPNADVKTYNNITGALLDLKAEKVDAVIVSKMTKDSYLAVHPSLKDAGILENNKIEGTYAFGFKKGSQTELREKINHAIEELIASGEIIQIKDKYILKEENSSEIMEEILE